MLFLSFLKPIARVLWGKNLPPTTLVIDVHLPTTCTRILLAKIEFPGTYFNAFTFFVLKNSWVKLFGGWVNDKMFLKMLNCYWKWIACIWWYLSMLAFCILITWLHWMMSIVWLGLGFRSLRHAFDDVWSLKSMHFDNLNALDNGCCRVGLRA